MRYLGPRRDFGLVEVTVHLDMVRCLLIQVKTLVIHKVDVGLNSDVLSSFTRNLILMSLSRCIVFRHELYDIFIQYIIEAWVFTRFSVSVLVQSVCIRPHAITFQLKLLGISSLRMGNVAVKSGGYENETLSCQ